MERFATSRRVVFFEEMIPTDHHLAYLEFHAFEGTRVTAVRPRVPDRVPPEGRDREVSLLLDQMMALLGIVDPDPLVLHADDVADRGARAGGGGRLRLHGRALRLPASRRRSFAPTRRRCLQAADVVFTGGHSLYEAKRALHDNVHPFPSSVDQQHFNRARGAARRPEEQERIPAPRLGYCGVIDERIDLRADRRRRRRRGRTGRS